MSEDNKSDENNTVTEKPSPVKVLLPSALSAIALGGVAAGAAFLLPSQSAQCPTPNAEKDYAQEGTKSYEDVAFVKLDPLVVSLGPNARSSYLKISITLETNNDKKKKVDYLRPKFRDVLNTYLRAVEEKDLSDPSAMLRLRAQMLRRIQLIAPVGAVENVLITDFVLN